MNNVIILLSTYNGEKYLKEQLDSLLEQKEVSFKILVRDDGSTDQTQVILDEYKNKGHLDWYTGENKGSAWSFMDLIYNAPNADFYAFCDQDDVWADDKLYVAVKKLAEFDKNTSSIYFSATNIVSKELDLLYVDNKPGFLFTFGESLFRNPVTGCTVVFNKALHDVLLSYKPDFLTMHDSWIYRVCLAIDGNIFFDSVPHINYRQHDNNVVGMKKGWKARWDRRYKSYKRGETGERLVTVKNILSGFGDQITDNEKKNLLIDLLGYKKSLYKKIKILSNPNVKTAKLEGRLAFVFAILFSRF